MPDENKPERKPPPREKKTWEPPRVTTGNLFESNSLACGKSDSSDDQCASQSFTVS